MFLLLLVALLTGPNTNYCELCHSDIKVEFKPSVHAQEGMDCVSCHGGNPAADAKERAHGGGFQSLKDRREILIACASCHSDSTKMKAYGLPTEQLALYQTSVHGKKLAAGDLNVAVCTDCHGVHRILPPTDPESLTHPRNIPKTCGMCHSDPKLMAGYKLPVSVVSDYEESIHGKALREGNQQTPVCTSCHGTHGAAPPGVGDVSIVCGHCHQAERKNFRLSPHQHAMAEVGIPECAGCHSNHKIQKTSYALWRSTCKECHSTNSVEIRRGQEIQVLLTGADAEILNAEGAIQEAAKIPLDVSDYQARLEEARTYMVQVLPVSHSLRKVEVEDLTRRARSVATEIQNELHEKREIFHSRRLVLIVIWFYILLTIVIVYQFKKQLEQK